jgi:hypothetical protein
MRPTEKAIHDLFETLQDTTRPELDEKILDACSHELSRIGDSVPAGNNSPWRLLMKNPFTKFTAAAMVFLAVILGITLFPNSKGPMALAGVLESLKNAVCISYDIQIGNDTTIIHDTVYENRIRREILGQTVIIDLNQMRMMTLSTETKQAVYINMDGLPELPKNYIEHLVHLLETLRDAKEGSFEELGPRPHDGRTLQGYLFTYQTTEVELWIDPETSLPAIITERTGGTELTCSHFDFAAEADPALFAMTPPEGYTVIDTQGLIDFKKDATEEAFIQGLRFLAGLRDGWFPMNISLEAFVTNAEEFGRLIEQNFEGTMAQIQASMQLGKSMVFLRFYGGRGPWHYAGNGVRLGEAGRPIFWYPPQGSDNYHVIFGDLHVEEVTEEDLESVVSQSDVNAGYRYQLWGQKKLTWEQEDLWRVKVGGVIEATSTLRLRQGPAFIQTIAMTLPVEGGEILSATLGGTGLPYQARSQTEYVFFPDGEQLANGADTIEVIWQFPLEKIRSDSTYTVPLKTLVQVNSFKLSAGIEPDSGYVWAQPPQDLEKSIQFSRKIYKDYNELAAKFTGQPPLVLFTTSGKSKSEFGTCGLAIKPR